jgi:prolyl-tRNA synthetase
VIQNDHELAVTQQRIQQFQALLLQLRHRESAENYALMATAYLLELDKMNEEIRAYLARPLSLPTAV